MFLGNLCMCFPRLTHSFTHVTEPVADFLTGFGVAIIISAFILEKRQSRNCSGTLTGTKSDV
jgi:hypothetical protein